MYKRQLLDEVKDREFIGYSYDGADASFELLARRIISKIPRYILIKEYDVSVKKDSSGTIVSSVVACIEGASVKLLPGSVFPKAMSMPFSGGGSRYLRPAKKRSNSTANRIKAVVQKDFFSYVVCKNAINLALLQGLP